jgi:antitoxin (DNA-binding transcriptional repressor) of toxin-antitoxin stability system
MATTTIRDLRNHFPKVREMVEAEGEVIVTDKGRPRYKLTLYTAPSRKTAASKDYVARLRRHQPKPISAKSAKALDDENRGEG